ncbi:unnamed protein product, partial [Rotaria sp. Silwood2]
VIRDLSIQRDVNIGYFYNAREDSIIRQRPFQNDIISKTLKSDSVYCQVFHGNQLKAEKLLDEIGTDYDLWLSLVLNIISIEGINVLSDSAFSVNKNTRIIHYCYIAKEQCIIDDIRKVKSKIRRATVNQHPTHVVTGIRTGVRVVIILELSTKDRANDALNLIIDALRNNDLNRLKDKKTLLSYLIFKKIFSNIQELTEVKTIFQLCKRIIQTNQLVNDHRPIQYFLSPIQSFCVHSANKAMIYAPLNQNNIMTIKQYLLPLCVKIIVLRTLINSKTVESFDKELTSLFHEIREDIQIINEHLLTGINPIDKLYLKFHYGIHGISVRRVETSLKEQILYYLRSLQLFKYKIEFIKQLEKQNIKYLNMENVSIQQNENLIEVLQKIIQPEKEELVFCCTEQLLNENLPKWNRFSFKWMKMYAKYGILDLTYADFSYQNSFMLSKIKILLIDSLSSSRRSKSLVIEPRKPSNARQKFGREERKPRSDFSSNSMNFETSHQ